LVAKLWVGGCGLSSIRMRFRPGDDAEPRPPLVVVVQPRERRACGRARLARGRGRLGRRWGGRTAGSRGKLRERAKDGLERGPWGRMTGADPGHAGPSALTESAVRKGTQIANRYIIWGLSPFFAPRLDVASRGGDRAEDVRERARKVLGGLGQHAGPLQRPLDAATALHKLAMRQRAIVHDV
jgi:hypothetical protein